MRFKFWLGSVFSLAVVFILLVRVDLGQLVQSVMGARFLPLVVAVLALLATQWIRSWRWYFLMESIKPTRFSSLLSATCIGAMTDMLMPARAGDLVRSYALGRREDVSKTASLATVLVERVFDILAILALSGPILLLFDSQLSAGPVTRALRAGLLVASGLCLVAIGLIILLRSRSRQVERYLGRKQSRLREHLRSFVAGLHSIRTGRHLLATVSLSLFLWLVFALSNVLVLHAFDLALPWYAGFLLLLFQAVGVTLPSSPGFLGTYHAAVLAALSLFGITGELALGVAVSMHAAFFFPFIALGLWFLWRENLSLRTLWRLDPATDSSLDVS